MSGMKGSDGRTRSCNEMFVENKGMNQFDESSEKSENSDDSEKDLLEDVLRGEWGFRGIVVTDYATANGGYMWIDMGLQNGGDLWLNSDKTVYWIDDIENNATLVNSLRRASHNILYTVVNSAAMNGFSEKTEIRNVLAAFLFTGDDVFKRISDLSGGERGRVSLAKLMLSEANFLILDEHTAALDPKTAELIMELTGKIVEEKKLTTIMVTHNLRYAVEYGNRLLMMHQGGVVMDLKGKEKEELQVEDILSKFNEISIECGN